VALLGRGKDVAYDALIDAAASNFETLRGS
jgi:hypothetical protein